MVHTPAFEGVKLRGHHGSSFIRKTAAPPTDGCVTRSSDFTREITGNRDARIRLKTERASQKETQHHDGTTTLWQFHSDLFLRLTPRLEPPLGATRHLTDRGVCVCVCTTLFPCHQWLKLQSQKRPHDAKSFGQTGKKKAGKQEDKPTGRQIDGQADRQADRQTGSMYTAVLVCLMRLLYSIWITRATHEIQTGSGFKRIYQACDILYYTSSRRHLQQYEP